MNSSEFVDHPVFENLKSFRQRLDEKEVIEKVETEHYEFYSAAISFVQNRLNSVLHILIPLSDLNNLEPDLNTALNNLNSFMDNDNAGHLNNTKNSLTSCLSKVKNFPTASNLEDNSVSITLAQFKKDMDSKISQLDKSLKEVNDYQDELDKKIQLSHDEQEQLNDQLIVIREQAENINEAIEGSFEQKSQEIEDRFSKANEIRDQSFKKITDEYDELVSTHVDNFKLTAKDLVSELEEKRDAGKKLLNIIGNIGVTGNYQLIANYHRKNADIFRVLAILFMVIMSTILLVTIFQVNGSDIKWELALIRIAAAAVLSYPATYCSRESAKHRKLENLNRRIELELASINPFIEFLEEDKQNEIKENLVSKYFGKDQTVEEDKAIKEEIPISLVERLVKLINSVK